jgi:hypothetical protein
MRPPETRAADGKRGKFALDELRGVLYHIA